MKEKTKKVLKKNDEKSEHAFFMEMKKYNIIDKIAIINWDKVRIISLNILGNHIFLNLLFVKNFLTFFLSHTD